MDLTNIYRIFFANTKQYIFSESPGNFSTVGQILRHKTNQQIQENLNNSLHSIRLHGYKAGYKKQKQQKSYKLLENKNVSAE